MKPGTTYLPRASIMRVAVASASLPMATIWSSMMPTSAVKGGASRAVEDHAAADEEVELLGGGGVGDEGQGDNESEEAHVYHKTGAG